MYKRKDRKGLARLCGLSKEQVRGIHLRCVVLWCLEKAVEREDEGGEGCVVRRGEVEGGIDPFFAVRYYAKVKDVWEHILLFAA